MKFTASHICSQISKSTTSNHNAMQPSRRLLSTCLAISLGLFSSQSFAKKVWNESTFKEALTQASASNTATTITLAKNVHIMLSQPLIYSGKQALSIVGNNALIDGSQAGSFILDEDLTAVTQDASLIFNTDANINLQRFSVVNSASRGIAINIPQNSEKQLVEVNLSKIEILDSALYGFHIDDNTNEFDDGDSGSNASIKLNISNSQFIGNGTGAIDFDGVRVDERADGDIIVSIKNTRIDGNGGDGMELDEAGLGSVKVSIEKSTINNNGFYNELDLDDGFDIDEAGEGHIEVSLNKVEANNNMDEGFDFDEADKGDIALVITNSQANNNTDEGIKLDEEDNGSINVIAQRSVISNNGDDGFQLTELGLGSIVALANKLTVLNNTKYGIKAEQWLIEDEEMLTEPSGSFLLNKTQLNANGSGDELKLFNISSH